MFRYKADPHDRTKTGPVQSKGFSRSSREAYLLKVFEPLTYYNIKLSARNRQGQGQEWEKILVAVSANDSKLF